MGVSVRISRCHNAPEMTDRIALIIVVSVIVVLVIDYALGLGIGLYLARRFLDLISLIAIWR